MAEIRTRTETDACFEAVQKLHEVRLLRIVDPPNEDSGLTKIDPSVIVRPEGVEIESIKPFLDEWRPHPERKEGQAELETVESFIDHANRFKHPNGAAALFATRGGGTRPVLVSVLDYHYEGNGSPQFGRHRGRYAFPISDEWKAWTSPREPMTIGDFAAFLDERIADVIADDTAGDAAKAWAALHKVAFASPSKLVELSRGLSVRVDLRVGNHVNPSSGEASLTFAEDHADEQGAPLKVPRAFLISIPVFRADAYYQIPARLSYRVNGGRVYWSFSLYRADAAFDHAFGTACRKAHADTQLPLFFGQPEGGA